MMKIKQNKLETYLAVTAGVGCAASAANAAVTFYGPGAQSPLSNPSTPAGIDLGFDSGSQGYYVDVPGSSDSVLGYEAGSGYFTSGGELSPGYTGNRGAYGFYDTLNNNTSFSAGAQAGDQNFALLSFDGDDGVYEAVGQFFFDGAGGGYLIAIATNDAPNQADALSIPDGKAMIDAVPEPSSLALLGLGSLGLAARRQRRKAA